MQICNGLFARAPQQKLINTVTGWGQHCELIFQMHMYHES